MEETDIPHRHMDNIDKVLAVVALALFLGTLYFIAYSNLPESDKDCSYQYHNHRRPTLICV